jgi:hypothetical protein
MTVAISRPMNLRDRLTKGSLSMPDSLDIDQLVLQKK